MDQPPPRPTPLLRDLPDRLPDTRHPRRLLALPGLLLWLPGFVTLPSS